MEKPSINLYAKVLSLNNNRNLRTQLRIQDLVKGAVSEAESCWHNKAVFCEQSELYPARIPGPLKDPGNFWDYNAFAHILETLFLSFLTSTSTFH